MSCRPLLDTFPMTQGQSRRTEGLLLKNKKQKNKLLILTGKTQELQRRRGWRDGRQAGVRTCCSFLRLSLSDPASLRRRTNRPSQLASPWERPERVVDKQSAAAAIFSTPNIPKVRARTVETAGGGGEWGKGGGLCVGSLVAQALRARLAPRGERNTPGKCT